MNDDMNGTNLRLQSILAVMDRVKATGRRMRHPSNALEQAAVYSGDRHRVGRADT